MSDPTSRSSNVITFYSYKGGTGRSMAVANTAWIIASNGHTVLTIDWDLEAPGLHRYFAPFLEDPKMAETDGLIDQLYVYQRATSQPPSADSSGSEWVTQYADVSRYAEPLTWEFPNGGRIDLLGAGRQDRRYGERVNLFDWQTFYGSYGGGAFFEKMIEQAREEYDYVLIDSRTGVSDTSGICTVHLPDLLAVFYTLNDQSIEGASAVARDALERRRILDRDFHFRVYPVATRIENAEKDKLHARLKIARRAFEPVVDFITDESERDAYFGAMQLQYEPYYAYEEILATVIDDPAMRGSLLQSFELLTSHITGGRVQKLTRVTETRRMEAKTSYTELIPPVARESTSKASRRYDVFVSFGSSDEEISFDLIRSLRSVCRVFDPEHSILPGESFDQSTDGALDGSRLVLAVLSRDVTPDQMRDIHRALEAKKIVIPVWRSRRAVNAVENILPEIASTKGLFLENPNDIGLVARSVTDLLGVHPQQQQQYQGPTSFSGEMPRAQRASWMSTWTGRIATTLVAAVVVYLLFSSILRLGVNDQGRSTFLASQAVQVRETDPVQSLLLARAAVLLDSNDFAATTLRGSLRASSEIRRFGGRGAPFIFASTDSQSNYVVATDVVGDSYIFQADSSSGNSVLIGRTREVAWSSVDRAGRPAVLAVLLDGSVTRWSPLDGNVPLFRLPGAETSDVSFGPRGEMLLQVTPDSELRVWDIRTREPVFEAKGIAALPAEPWSSDGSSFVVFNTGGRFSVFSANGDRQFSPSPKVDPSAVRDVLLNSDGSRMLLLAGGATAIYGSDGPIFLNEEVQRQATNNRNVLPSNNRQRPALANTAARPRPLTPTAANWMRIPGVDGAITPRGEAPNRRADAIALGYGDGTAAVWVVSDDGETLLYSELGIASAGRGGDSVAHVDFSPRGDRLLAATGSSIRVFTFQDSSPQVQIVRALSTDAASAVTLAGHAGQVNDAEWGGSGNVIVSASQDGTVRIWDPDASLLSLDMPAEELLKLTEMRLPRRFTEDEAEEFGVSFEPVPEPSRFEAVPEKGLQEAAE